MRRGGRQRGTPNRKTVDLVENVQRVMSQRHQLDDWDPVVGLALTAEDPHTPLTVRVTCLKEVAKYWHPRRKPVEPAAPEISENELESLTEEELTRLILAELDSE